MEKRKSSEPTAPLWCLSYGDMVTNMLCFFVMLFSFAHFQDNKRLGLVLNAAFGKNITLSSQTGAGQKILGGERGILLMPHPNRFNEMPRIVKKVKKHLLNSPLTEKIGVTGSDQNVKLRIPSEVLFFSGQANLREGSDKLLIALAPVLGQISNDIRIDGHTDDIPTSGSGFPSNWELSSARACSIVRFFTEQTDMDPMRFSAQGYGSTRPEVENSTEENRTRNRRVEIVILSQKRKRSNDEEKWE
ncbi:OmpA family protein [bacterium]|nr:OmpA family protein [bacterium]